MKFLWYIEKEESFFLQVFELPKIHLVNLFGMWEVGAPKVGAPSSHVMSPGPLFIGDAPDGFWLRFLGDPEEKDVEIIEKKLKKFWKKKE